MSNSDVTNTQPTPIAEVTQGDREKAASMMDIQGGPNTMPSHIRMGQDDGHPVVQAFARHRLTALADAERKLEDMCASLECAAGCDEGVTKDQAYSEILSWGGSAVASSYASARQEIERLKKV